MCALAEAGRIMALMEALGSAVHEEGRVYVAGGSSAVLMGWRATTVDVNIAIVPNSDAVLRELPALKERLGINIELASPLGFLPELPGWKDRSVFIAREGLVSFFHFDFYSQALSKIERGHAMDRLDVNAMLESGLVLPNTLRELFEAVVPNLYRFPAVDPQALRRAVEAALAGR